MRTLLTALLFASAAIAPAAAADCNVKDWNGSWQTEFGWVALHADDGGIVTGTYEMGDGKIGGTLDKTGCTLTGSWVQNGPNPAPEDTGTFVFVLDDSGDAWIGQWAPSSDPMNVGEWSGTRGTDPGLLA